MLFYADGLALGGVLEWAADLHLRGTLDLVELIRQPQFECATNECMIAELCITSWRSVADDCSFQHPLLLARATVATHGLGLAFNLHSAINGLVGVYMYGRRDAQTRRWHLDCCFKLQQALPL